MAVQTFRINYKSDFILTLESDAGWMTPFCIKFWTGAPSQAFFVGWDGETYTHCAYDPSEPTKLLVQFDDHHLPIGDLKFQIAYHFTVADFPNDTEDEVINPASITTEIDGETYQVMLDFTGETAPEIQFSLPAYANEAQRIANEQQRVQNEETRIVHEETRQRNEATRIAQEEARVSEFARLKRESQQATRDANDAATLANQKAQLAQDKAALAQEAATLANQKAQLAADKAALANDAAQLANEKAALANQKAEYAQQQGGYAKDQGDYAKDQGDYAKAQGTIAEEDHQRAEADHGIAVDDHTQAGNDHTRAESDHGIAVDDHTQAGNDHTRAESDHGIAVDDHTQAGNDHTRAESDHGIAADDHTQAGNDHTRAESDHTRAESDHAAVEVYVDSLGVFDLSKHNAVGGVLATYADLSAALTALNALESKYKYGGMSFKFVSSSDNKYVQYRLKANVWSPYVSDWYKEDVEAKQNTTTGGTDLLINNKVIESINARPLNTELFSEVGTWNTGEANTNPDFVRTPLIPINGDILAWCYDGGTQYPGIGITYFDIDGEYISTHHSSETSGGERFLQDTPPTNARFFAVCVHAAYKNIGFIRSNILSKLTSIIPEFVNLVGNFKQPTTADILKGKYLYYTGELKSAGGFGYCMVDVSKIRGYALTETKLEAAGGPRRYAFLKSYTDSAVVFSDISGYSENYLDNVVVPSDANYLYIMTTNSYDWNFVPKFESDAIIDGELVDIGKKIDSVALKDLYFSKTATSCSIYRKYKDGKYIKDTIIYGYKAYTGGTTYPDNYDVWYRSSTSLGTLDNDLNWTEIAVLTGGAVQEIAIDVPADNQSGHAYVGSVEHGFEKIVVSDNIRNITMLVNGEAIGESSVVAIKPISSFEVYQKTILYQAFTNSNEFAEVEKHWIWDRVHSTCKMDTKILRNIRIVGFACGMMLVPQRYNLVATGDDYVGNKAIKGNLPYTIYTLEGAWSSSIPIYDHDPNCNQIYEYGSGIHHFGYSLKVLNATRKQGEREDLPSGMNVSNNGGTTFNKIYNSLAVFYDAAADEKFSAEVEWIID